MSRGKCVGLEPPCYEAGLAQLFTELPCDLESPLIQLLQEKRYRSMQEHIRRAHPSHYIPKLPATEESFLMMVNTPLDQRAQLSPPEPAQPKRPHGQSAPDLGFSFPFDLFPRSDRGADGCRQM